MSQPDQPGRTRVPRGAVTAADGLVVVDKPQGVTSHDVVGMTRRLAATRKVGHAGTLDPMATGVLLLGVGKATRFLTYLVGADKTYTATLRLGQETLTEDAQGEVTSARGCHEPDLACAPGEPWGRLDAALEALTGEVMQVPSAVSAIKVDGVRSYTRVRAGEDVELAARPVTVHALDRCGLPRAGRAADGTSVVDVDIEVRCSSGTYVRALARDLGRALGCGAHLTALRRVAVGPFRVDEAASVQVLAALVEADAASDRPLGMPTMPLEEVARRCLPSVRLSAAQARAVSYGQALEAGALEDAVVPDGSGGRGGGHGPAPVAGFAPDGRLVALLSVVRGRVRPVLVLAPAVASAV